MLSRTKTRTTVGVDIEAGSIAAAEVSANGEVKVAKHAVVPLETGVFTDGEVGDADALAEALKQMFSANQLARTVRLGVASQRVVVRTFHLPPIADPAELETAIRFQAHDRMPMPLDQAVLDWEVTSHTAGLNGEPGIEVVAVAARRDMVETAMEALRKAGLRPVGIDLSVFGMIRALAGEATLGSGVADGSTLSYEQRVAQQRAAADAGVDPGGASLQQPARLFYSLGDIVNLAVAQGRTCRFTRISPFGIEGIAQRLAAQRQLTLAHARQWLAHVGLEAPVEQIQGDPEVVGAARTALAEGLAKLVDELRLSLEYYGTQDGAVPVEDVVACGPGTMIPGLVERLQAELGYPFQVGRPQALAHLAPAAIARLTTAYGLGLED